MTAFISDLTTNPCVVPVAEVSADQAEVIAAAAVSGLDELVDAWALESELVRAEWSGPL